MDTEIVASLLVIIQPNRVGHYRSFMLTLTTIVTVLH